MPRSSDQPTTIQTTVLYLLNRFLADRIHYGWSSLTRGCVCVCILSGLLPRGRVTTRQYGGNPAVTWYIGFVMHGEGQLNSRVGVLWGTHKGESGKSGQETRPFGGNRSMEAQDLERCKLYHLDKDKQDRVAREDLLACYFSHRSPPSEYSKECYFPVHTG